ncbi:methyltransferase domain-containing protein [Pseudoduganella umbonata]|uniref:Methyltransferase domain-containing protein n=1 Tax=Pseudoduganella umbonata TaxID=864828 RepID=A0A4P8HS40_9BURK|nr:methyltransferase domain-containing protein [Pseudoduganella umbonata]MBB3224427.1 SAM-dependent methyltransferase [Pseudoduganella umbonata]QCP11215.1 methyltransferase domain-containing protein [Pseudoduganella umbonata]
MTSIPYYEQHAARLADQYESLDFNEVHAGLLDLLPPPGGIVLDVGAGSGRDAAWFAANGYEVVAVDPSDAMLAQARRLHPADKIRWLPDSLPDLAKVPRLGLRFDLILLSAVWMHIRPADRQRSLRKLATLLAPNGRIAISLRLGAPDTERAMHEVSLQELAALARQFGLRIVQANDSPDKLGRSEVSWTNVVLGLPDDGLGALPLLRHLILADEKASTYKIALLRVIARIADTAAGLVRHEAESVVIPLGLVSLFWLRMYKPLIENQLPQMPPSRLGTGPGFVTDNFHALRQVAPIELGIGSVFMGDTGRHLHRSLTEISHLIRRMPATYLRWPASDNPIFKIDWRRQTSTPSQLQIDEPFLWGFGDFHVPLDIWQALTHYNVWIEPVLVAEWVRLIEAYSADRLPDVRMLAQRLLTWADPLRDTTFARAAVERIRATGKTVYCVWTGARLGDEYDIDHCFPFAAWPCGDAWNLMPSARLINIQKSNRLVTQTALERASDRITEWWADAFIDQAEGQRQRFFLEAAQTLPLLVASPGTADVIDAMKIHRIRLSKDQGLRSWEPVTGRSRESASKEQSESSDTGTAS